MTHPIGKRLAAQAIAGLAALALFGTAAATHAHEPGPPVPTISVSATGNTPSMP